MTSANDDIDQKRSTEWNEEGDKREREKAHLYIKGKAKNM